jgi:DNA-binding transcriptional LysR family regulator
MQTNLDLDAVRAFLAVADEKSFSRAAERLLRGQSGVSLQIKRLEAAVGRRLLDRTPRNVSLTPQGEAFMADAQRLIEMNDAAIARLTETQVTGTVRLGTPEDFATSHLPRVLERFGKAYPGVALEVTCDLTLNLARAYREKAFDMVLLKREPQSAGPGIRVWRENLVWVAAQPRLAMESDPLPLVASPPPCVYRKRAVAALDGAGRRWRMAYSCASLAGVLAAVRAGLGVAVLPREMVPADLTPFEGPPLPPLRDAEIALLSARRLSLPARKLHEHIVRSLERMAP